MEKVAQELMGDLDVLQKDNDNRTEKTSEISLALALYVTD